MPAKHIGFISLFACLLPGVLSAQVPQAGGPPARPALPIVQTAAENVTEFRLDGRVMTPAAYDRAALAALPQSNVTIGNVTYSGVPLWTLLSKAGLITHPESRMIFCVRWSPRQPATAIESRYRSVRSIPILATSPV
jgi:hypothetical protein